MLKISSLFKNWRSIKLTTGVTLSLLLLAPPAFSAKSNSDDPPPDTRGNSGGSRGCNTRTKTSADNIPALISLAPAQGFGQTVATPPTFTWFVRDSGSWPLKFKLYTYDPATKQAKSIREIQDKDFRSLPGIMMLSLPNLVLSIGQKYIWEVELICNPNHPSGNLFASAATRVVQMPPDLKAQLSHIHERDRFNKAALYAKAGLWYDTLGIALTPGDDPRLKELKFSLLQQVAAASTDREKVGVRLTESAVYQVQR